MSQLRILFLLSLLSFPLLGKQHTSKPGIIEKITINGHNCIDLDEFSYLTDLTIGSLFSPEMLVKAKNILDVKKRFKNITFEWHQNKMNRNYSIICHLEPNLIIKKIRIKGSINNRSIYEQLYQQQPGAPFSQEAHQKSLIAIKERLAFDGYLQGSVTASLQKDEKTKTVGIHLTIDTGQRFFITDVNLALRCSNIIDKKTASSLISSKLQSIFNPFIKRYQYNQDRVKKWAKLIKKILCELGYLKPKLHIKIKVDNKTHNVRIFFVIQTTTPRYIFEGNTKTSKTELLECLNYYALANKPLQNSIIKHQIKRLYQTKGYWQPEIFIAKIADNYHIKILEGPALNIVQIRIQTLQQKQPPFPCTNLTKGINKIRCTRTFIKELLPKIIQLGIKNGFWDCKVIATKLLVSKKNKNECLLKITLSPGEQRILSNIQINEPKKTSVTYPLDLLNANINKAFDPQILTETRKQILHNLYHHGYWYSSVDYVLRPDEENRRNITLFCTIDPGEQVVFGKLIVQGYTKLPFQKILKNCHFPEGSIWDQKIIDSSRSRLHQLEIFDHVKFSAHQRTHPSGDKHIIANILDDDPYEARLKLGFFASSEKPFLKDSHTLSLAGSYRVKNPLNKADMFIIGAQADSTEQQVTVQYCIPELLGKNQINSFALATENRRYMFNLTEPIETVIERRTGLKISAEPATIFNKTQFGWSAGIDSSKLLGYHGNMNLDPVLTEKSLFFIYVEPIFKRISLDDKKSMAEGFSTEVSARFLVPFVSHGNSPLLRVCFKQRFAKNIHPLLGAVFTLRCGHIFSDNKFSTIHPNDRFYLGGADTIRGYSKDTLPPLGSYKTDDGKTGYTVQGGKTLLQINSELRQRITKNTELLFFHDIGSLGQDSIEEVLRHIYRTLGAGTRIYTPVGIIKFDIGYKLSSSYPNEHSYNWHLSFDGSF